MSAARHPRPARQPKPRVSVVLATFNRPDSLGSAIASVVAQTCPHWELLVVNDGGTDVGHIVAAFDDSRIRYFNQQRNRGKAACCNIGLSHARGDYIAYLDDDDIWYSHHLAALAAELDRHPRLGGVYSDLYAVHYVKDPDTGRRLPVHKFIQVSRDFNRDFVFHGNPALHVALMHRREPAMRAGGYNEDLTVLVDWNIVRKLCFYSDLRHVPMVTGEYYLPRKADSDRCSDRERSDAKRFARNLRKIKADLPPGPWPAVDRISAILPVDACPEATAALLANLVDHICYPIDFVLVNSDPEGRGAGLGAAIGSLGELANVKILTPAKALSATEAYRFGAQRTDADYVYLPSAAAKADLMFRLTSARSYLKHRRKCRVFHHEFKQLNRRPHCGLRKRYDGIKWDVDPERSSPFDLLIATRRFLELTDPQGGEGAAQVALIPAEAPASFAGETAYRKMLACRRKADRVHALQQARRVMAAGRGGPCLASSIGEVFKVCADHGALDGLEARCRALIEQGYEPDNRIRLGHILHARGRYAEAIVQYQGGLRAIGLTEADLASKAFPIVGHDELDAFDALLGIGRCHLALGSPEQAAPMFRLAQRIKGGSPLPFREFGRLYLYGGQPDKARQALTIAYKMQPEDAETRALLNRTLAGPDPAARGGRRPASGAG